MQQPRLIALIGVDLQSVIVRPGDVQASRNPHHSGSAVRFALLARRFVFRRIPSVGHTPRPPIILTNISVAERREEAQERAAAYLSRKWDSIDAHYHFSDGHLASVKGYEFYGGMAKTYSKMKDPGFRKKATDFYVKIQIVGTPDDCIQQVAELQRLTGLDHLATEFGFGGMPHEQAELNMRLFAERVMPVLQRDRMFAAPKPRPQDKPPRGRWDVKPADERNWKTV